MPTVILNIHALLYDFSAPSFIFAGLFLALLYAPEYFCYKGTSEYGYWFHYQGDNIT